MRELAVKSGWEIMCEEVITADGKKFCPDMSIYFNGKKQGYIEVLFYKRPETFIKRIKEIKKLYDDTIKPHIFIITNGDISFISIDGSEFQVVGYFPGPDSYIFKNKIIARE